MRDILTRLELLRRGQLAGEDEGVQAGLVDEPAATLSQTRKRFVIELVLLVHVVGDGLACVAVPQRRGHVKKMTVAETEVEG